MLPLRREDLSRRRPRRAAVVLTALLLTASVAAVAVDRLAPGDPANDDPANRETTPGAAAPADYRSVDLTAGDLTPAEQQKLARAREAMIAAEAAGTRWIEAVETPPERFSAADAARKLQRARSQEPQPRRWTPGVGGSEPGGER